MSKPRGFIAQELSSRGVTREAALNRESFASFVRGKFGFIPDSLHNTTVGEDWLYASIIDQGAYVTSQTPGINFCELGPKYALKKLRTSHPDVVCQQFGKLLAFYVPTVEPSEDDEIDTSADASSGGPNPNQSDGADADYVQGDTDSIPVTFKLSIPAPMFREMLASIVSELVATAAAKILSAEAESKMDDRYIASILAEDSSSSGSGQDRFRLIGDPGPIGQPGEVPNGAFSIPMHPNALARHHMRLAEERAANAGGN